MIKEFFVYEFKATYTTNKGSEITSLKKVFREKKPDHIYLDHSEKINRIAEELKKDHFYDIQFEDVKVIKRNMIE